MSEKGNEHSPSDQQALNAEEQTEEEGEKAKEVEPKIAELVKGILGKRLRKFYQVIALKYSDKESGWTLVKIEADSPRRLAPIIRELRGILEAAGAVRPDDLIADLIEFAQAEAVKKSTEEDFLSHVFNHQGMAAGTGIERFYRKVAIGVKKQSQGQRASPNRP